MKRVGHSCGLWGSQSAGASHSNKARATAWSNVFTYTGVLICQMIVLWCLLPQYACTYSGLYFDNGVDQTIMHRTLSRKEKVIFQREILNVLEIFETPKISNLTLASSGPKFLLDIYKSFDGRYYGPTKEFDISGDDIKSIRESDSIITFLSRNRHVNIRHERRNSIWFDLSGIQAKDSIMKAELRLYHEKQIGLQYTVTLYQISSDYNGEKELEFIDTVNTTSNDGGWLLFNVSKPVNSLVAMPSFNLGIYISIHTIARTCREVSPEYAGIISTSVTGKEEKQPFIVAFIKSGAGSNHRRTTRDTRKTKSDEDFTYPTNPFTPEPTWTFRRCQIQTLYINFKDLKWHEWIIAPDGYAAFYCSGLCDFPLKGDMNATNHAIVQSLVHLIDPLEAPRPCCAPTKLGSISVLYYLEDSSVILRKYQNMIVKSCGCH